MRTPRIVVLASFILIAGCGRASHEAIAAPASQSTQTFQAAVPITDACTLVPRSDVATIFGELKGEPKSSTGMRGERECRYQSLEGHWLQVSVYGVERWDLEKGIVSEQHPEAINGLGEEAFTVKQGTDRAIYVRKGPDILEVRCSCPVETAKAIATKAIGKI